MSEKLINAMTDLQHIADGYVPPELDMNEAQLIIDTIEQLQKEHNILTEFEKWLEETINYLERSKESRNEYKLQILIYKHCLINLQELKEGKK